MADASWLAAVDPETQRRDTRPALDALVAGVCREALDPGQDPGADEWKALELTPADLDGLDPRDRVFLEAIVRHELKPAQVSQIAEAILAGEEVFAKEVEALADLREFRDDDGGAEGRGDGQRVGHQAVTAAPGGR